ncbi:MAG TPA: hypothetical protein VGZ68_06310 [Acidimicrobiales bacterium]|jgi:hypothetical protein|nr:hypothetical protein [Acidimicrobiales bacterium]
MRRALLAALFVASSVGILTLPAAADTPLPLPIVLSFDFSDNSLPASVSNGDFNVITDVLPDHTAGVVRMVAIAPDNSGASNLVCPFQSVQKSQAECAFNFTANGVWTVRAQFAQDNKSDVTSVSITRLRVTN